MPTGKIRVDFSKAVVEAVPEGHYSIAVHEVEVRQGTDAPYLNWDLIITEGDHQGRHLFARTSLTEKALWRLLPFVEALGFEEEIMDLEFDEETGVVLFPDFIGAVATAVVWHELYQGSTRAQVSELLPMKKGSGLKIASDSPKRTSGPTPAVRAPKPEPEPEDEYDEPLEVDEEDLEPPFEPDEEETPSRPRLKLK